MLCVCCTSKAVHGCSSMVVLLLQRRNRIVGIASKMIMTSMHQSPALDAQHRQVLPCMYPAYTQYTMTWKILYDHHYSSRAACATAGVLPPCGHACHTVVLVDQGLSPLQHPPHAQFTHQATSESTHVDCATETSPLQLPGHHGLGATEQSSRHSALIVPPECPHWHAASGVQWPSDHAQTCNNGPSSHALLNSAQLGTPRTETAHLSSGVQAAQCTDTLYCGAGRLDSFLALSFHQLLALSNGQAVDLVQSCATQSNSDGSSGPQQGRTMHSENTFLLDSMCGRLCRWLRSAPVHHRLANALQDYVSDTYPCTSDTHIAKAL